MNFDTIRYHLTGPWAICAYTLIFILWVTDGYAWYSNGKLYIEERVKTEEYSTEFEYKYKLRYSF